MEWDAFLSYSSRDREVVGRVHRFLEGYRLPGGRRLRIYRDETDIQGGELPGQIREALAASACLLVCCSRAAAGSRWVDREIQAFREARPDGSVLPILVADDTPDLLPAGLRGRELRWADVRRGWWPGVGLPRTGTRRELVRAVAAVSGIPFRELLPLDRRRRRRVFLGGAGAGVAGLVLAGSVPVEGWESRTPAGAGVVGGCDAAEGAVVLYHHNIPQAQSSIVQVLRGDSVLGTLDAWGARGEGRLVPAFLRGGASSACRAPGGAWVGGTGEEVCVVLEASRELLALADRSGGTEWPATEVVVDGRRSLLEEPWRPPSRAEWEGWGRTVTPSQGRPVSRSGDDVWLGFPADETFLGALWHSSDGGGSWSRRSGLRDVRSVRHTRQGVLVVGRRDQALGLWRVTDTVEAVGAPGRGGDLEVCGEEDGRPVIRSGGEVYRRIRGPWWRVRLGGEGRGA